MDLLLKTDLLSKFSIKTINALNENLIYNH